jgi:hypothetical protein
MTSQGQYMVKSTLLKNLYNSKPSGNIATAGGEPESYMLLI